MVHYSDKAKAMAQDAGFADNTPERMRALVLGHGFEIVPENTTAMWNGRLCILPF
jgi:hypothetical protein